MNILLLPLSLTLLCTLPVYSLSGESPREDLAPLLAPIRAKYHLPALAGVILTGERIMGEGVVGVRKYGSPIKATINDQFHLGSDTKAMTATLVAMLIEQGRLHYHTTLAAALPRFAKEMLPVYRSVTIEMLLAQRSGFSDQSWPPGQTFMSLHKLPGSPMQQREAYARMILADAPVNPPGSAFLYSNRNYALLGIIAEQNMGIPWEKLITERLFTPLGMKSAGFGAMGSPGKITQPWQHTEGADGMPVPIEPGPFSDNPEVIGPAGTVHCSLPDWAKFLQLHLRGEEGKNDLLKAADIRRLHAPLLGGTYASGWLVAPRPWAGGDALTHAGSNNMNYAVAWMAPRKDFAVLIATNTGGKDAFHACDEAASALITHYLTNH